MADELIAHFADAMAAGVSTAQAVRDFGDERAAAKLDAPGQAARAAARLANLELDLASDGRGRRRVCRGRGAVRPSAGPRPSVDYVAELAGTVPGPCRPTSGRGRCGGWPCSGA